MLMTKEVRRVYVLFNEIRSPNGVTQSSMDVREKGETFDPPLTRSKCWGGITDERTW